MSDTNRGLYRKFEIRRTDGSSKPGGKHANCSYFVLDLTHDPFALPALRAYAEACRETHPYLATELERVAKCPQQIDENKRCRPLQITASEKAEIYMDADERGQVHQ
jgi:hypothetical protein